MVKLKEKLLYYKENFEKQIQLSQLEKVKTNALRALDIYNMIESTIIQHNYKGTIYRFKYKCSPHFIKDGEMAYNNQEMLKLKLEDFSNVVNLFLLQRVTKIVGVESAIFSLVNVNEQETEETHGLEMEYQGYLMLSEWYDENEKKKIVTSIHAILNHEGNKPYLLSDHRFSFEQIDIGHLGENTKKDCSKWKIDYIYVYFFGLSTSNYTLGEDLCLYRFEKLEIGSYEIKIRSINMNTVDFVRWMEKEPDKWESLFDCYFSDQDLVKSIFYDYSSSDIITGLLNETEENYNVYELDRQRTLESIKSYMEKQKKEKLEAIYEKLENRTKNNSEIWKLKKLKQNWLKMYYLYFLKNDLCAKWNGVYRCKGEELIYYSSYYDLYKRKEEIRKWINDLYGFYYMDEEYVEFSYIELLKNKKRLPSMNFYMSMCGEKKEKLTKEVMCLKSYLCNKKDVLFFFLTILMFLQIFL